MHAQPEMHPTNADHIENGDAIVVGVPYKQERGCVCVIRMSRTQGNTPWVEQLSISSALASCLQINAHTCTHMIQRTKVSKSASEPASLCYDGQALIRQCICACVSTCASARTHTLACVWGYLYQHSHIHLNCLHGTFTTNHTNTYQTRPAPVFIPELHTVVLMVDYYGAAV